MVLDSVFERLVDKAPVTVMVRGTLENVLSREALDRLFLSKAKTGYSRKLLFSQMVDLMGMVVARVPAADLRGFSGPTRVVAGQHRLGVRQAAAD